MEIELAVKFAEIPFKLSPQPIQYKKLKPEHFTWANGDTKYEIIEPDKETGYVSDQLYETLKKDFENSNTCIINIGVGRGKTTTACNIIHHYASQPEYVVILASPFKKLVQRDYKNLMERDSVYKVANYEFLENEEIDIVNLVQTHQVHIITLNSLMFNPGEDNLKISGRKSFYCNSIKEYCRRNNKKVVFVFDEIHAGIHCFQEEFIFNLRAWKDITHKCFILSATFTEPARVAIEYIAYLTDYKLYIAETERQKFPTQSNLHLYITDGKYSARDLSLLDPLKAIVADAVPNKKKVHIVTAFKDLAEKLVNTDETHPLIQAIEELDPNLVTGESNFEFNPATSNIGTTFYTGIDLKHEDDVLVLIMPSAESQFADKIGGIFSTGKVAISQAIARLRTNGDIHVFLAKPDVYIEGDYTEHVATEILAEEHEPAFDDEEQLNLLTTFYRKERAYIEREISNAKDEIKGHNWDDRAPINYPGLASFILNKGMSFLIQKYASFGKGFTPYVLWAALNDQFENTTLKSIYFIQHQTKSLQLQKGNFEEGLLAYYGGEEQVRELIEGKDLKQAFGILFGQLGYQKLPDDSYGSKVNVYIDGKPVKFHYTTTAVKQAIFNIIVSIAQEAKTEITADHWIKSQIALYRDTKNLTLKKKPESIGYIKLEKTREEYCNRVAKNNMIASPELFDADFLFECLEAVRNINKYDKFLTNKTYSFCRLSGAEMALPKGKKNAPKDKKAAPNLTLKDIKAGGKQIDNLRKRIFNAYKSNFTKFEFAKKGSAKIDSFLPIPRGHFYSNSKKPKLSKALRAQLEAEYAISKQSIFKSLLSDAPINEVDFKVLVKTHRALHEKLGYAVNVSDDTTLLNWNDE